MFRFVCVSWVERSYVKCPELCKYPAFCVLYQHCHWHISCSSSLLRCRTSKNIKRTALYSFVPGVSMVTLIVDPSSVVCLLHVRLRTYSIHQVHRVVHQVLRCFVVITSTALMCCSSFGFKYCQLRPCLFSENNWASLTKLLKDHHVSTLLDSFKRL